MPSHWKTKRLKYLLEPNVENMKVGPFGSALSGGDIVNEGKWVYNQRVVLDNNFEDTDSFITEEKFQEMRGFKVNPGDLLITTRGTIGKIAIVPDNAQEGILHPCIIKFRVNRDLILPDLVKIIFNESDIVKDQFVLMSNATTIEVIYDDIQKAFAPYYTETVLAETITPSDIRAVEAKIDEYNFLDYDDITTFNEYLYQEKRTSKDKAKMWSLLDKSLKIINKHSEMVKLEIRATIKRFIRFYSFLIQATCFESVDLHKKYNFLTYLVKEIEVGGGGNDFDIADKITASNFKQKKTGEQTSSIESTPDIALPKPNPVIIDEIVKKKLSEIIDEINASYNKNFDVDVATKAALQVRDILLKNGHLRDSAKSNTLRDFKFAYFDAVQDALIEGYEQNQDFFALLLDNDEQKRELMQVFLEDVYKRLNEEK